MELLRNRNGKLPIVIIIVLALVVVGGLGLVKFIKHRKHGKVVKPPPELSMMKMPEFTVNLADKSESHYLKVDMALEIEGKVEPASGGGEAAGQSPEMVKASDAIITVMTAKHFNELLTDEGKEELKADLVKGLNEAFEKKIIVHKIYFTSFAMQ